jgi:hypothetical protein
MAVLERWVDALATVMHIVFNDRACVVEVSGHSDIYDK